MKLYRYAIPTAIVLATAAMIQAPQALASRVASTAAGACQASLPLHDANLRKRPLGIRNEGASSSFVSCGLQWGHLVFSTQRNFVIATNQNSATVDLTCTLVAGPLPGLAGYYPQTVALQPHGTDAIEWLPSEFNDLPNYVNVSCNVPPGVEINVVGSDYTSIGS